MTMVTLDLARLSDDDLGLVFKLDSEEAVSAALAEATWREAAQGPDETVAPSPVPAAMAGRTDWEAAAHAQFLAASEACAGRLLSRRGREAVRSELDLWRGPEVRARAYASEELNLFWDEHPRLTITAYRDGLAASRRDEREAASHEQDHDSQVKEQDSDMSILAGQTLNGHDLAAGDAGESALLDALAPAGPPPEPEAAGELDGVTNMAAVPERPMIPLDLGAIPLVLPRGDAALLYGRGGIGKGRLTHSLIAQVTRDGGDVIGVWPEDKPDEQIRSRLEAAGADPSRVWDMTRLSDGTRFKLSATARDEGHISLLRAFVKRLRDAGRDPRLVIIDPVSAVVGWGTIQTVAGARRLIEPVQDFADTTGCAVLLIGHPRKDGKLAGSEGLRDALRVIYEVTVDPVNAAYRVITMEKGNDLTASADGLRFTIGTGVAGRPRVEWVDRRVMDAERAAWRDRLATTSPAADDRHPAAAFAAAWSVRRPGCPAEAHLFDGSWPGLRAAQDACQASAAEPLAWQRSTRRPDCWRAVTYPSGPSGPEVSYAVSAANGRQS